VCLVFLQGRELTISVLPLSFWLVPTLTLASAVNILSARALPVFLPLVAADLGTSVAVLGQVPASMLLLAGVLALIAGPLADQYGYRPMLVVGLLTIVVSTVATGLAPTFPILLVVTLVGAVARAAVMPTAQAVVVTRISDEGARRRAISWVTAGMSAAAIIGIPFLTTIAGMSSWRMSFFVLGALAFVSALLLWPVLGRSEHRMPTPFRVAGLLAAYGPIRRHAPTRILTVSTLVANVGLWATFTYQTAFVIERYAWDIQAAGWGWLVQGFLVLFGILLMGGRLGVHAQPLLLGARVATALTLGAALVLPLPDATSLALLGLAAFLAGAGDVATTLVLTVLSPAGRATTLTLNSAAVCIGTALGSALGGLALALGSYEAVGLCSLTTLVAAGGLVWWSTYESQRPRPHANDAPSSPPDERSGPLQVSGVAQADRLNA
jgi:MFS transporter, DHA1 family, inner membrane transport protein